VVNDGHPNSLALTPDGRQLYAVLNWGGGVAVVDVATSTIVDTFGVAAAPHVPRLSDISLSSTAPAVGRGTRFAPQPRRGEPCFP
jgi:DNA-binding beta-propeller fold protein YncE